MPEPSGTQTSRDITGNTWTLVAEFTNTRKPREVEVTVLDDTGDDLQLYFPAMHADAFPDGNADASQMNDGTPVEGRRSKAGEVVRRIAFVHNGGGKHQQIWAKATNASIGIDVSMI